MYSWIFMPVRDVIAASQDESLICRGRQRGKLAAKSISHDLCLDWVFPFFLCFPLVSPPPPATATITKPSLFFQPWRRNVCYDLAYSLSDSLSFYFHCTLSARFHSPLVSSLSIRYVGQVRQNLISARIARQNRLRRLARCLFLYVRYSASCSDKISAWKLSRALNRMLSFHRSLLSLPLSLPPSLSCTNIPIKHGQIRKIGLQLGMKWNSCLDCALQSPFVICTVTSIRIGKISVWNLT